MPSTVLDVWRLVTQYNIRLIVAFEMDSIDTDETFANYLPSEADKEFVCSPFKIKSVYTKEETLWQEQELIISLDKSSPSSSFKLMEKECHSLIHLKCKFNEYDSSKWLSFIKKARQQSSPDGRILYLCGNGAMYSGLACTLSQLLDRIDHDASIAVPLVVGSIKSVRLEVIPTLEQYTLLHEVLLKYSQTYSEYINFKVEQKESINNESQSLQREGTKTHPNY